MTLLKDNNYKEINIALLSLEADIKKLSSNNINFNTDSFDAQLADINKRIDEINGLDETVVKNLKNDVIAINSNIDNINTEINGINTNIEGINTEINGINTNIDNIEQQLSNIFTAKNKVTDFNTTTDSGIYYWLSSSANKPGTDYGVLLVNKYDSGDGSLWINQIAYGTNGRIYFRQKINDNNWTSRRTIAYYDEIEKTTTKSLSLNTVSTDTIKYIKLGVFNWSNSFSFRCRIYGNGLEDNVNINILGGISSKASVCGYYSTNSSLTKSIIVKRGNAWNDNFEIYLKILQVTTANITITVEKIHQGRIVISESTTEPTGNLEEITFNKISGMFSSNIDAKSLVLESNADVELNTFGNEPLSIGNINSTNLGIDGNEIQARDNGKAGQLNLNNNGGDVKIGNGNVTGTKLILQGATVSSNSYTDTNPKIVFNNADASQNISLTFNDYDEVQAPASLTLNGNQGNEYFIAPCIKANNVMRIPTSEPSTKENGCIWIG